MLVKRIIPHIVFHPYSFRSHLLPDMWPGLPEAWCRPRTVWKCLKNYRKFDQNSLKSLFWKLNTLKDTFKSVINRFKLWWTIRRTAAADNAAAKIHTNISGRVSVLLSVYPKKIFAFSVLYIVFILRFSSYE